MLKDAGKRLRIAAVLAVAAALAVAGVASARDTGADSTGTEAAKASGPPAGPKGGPGGKGGPGPGAPMPPAVGGPNLTNGVLHVLGKDGEEETIRLDQGKIVAIDDGSLSLKENDGSTVTVKVDSDTAVMDPEAGPGEGSLDDLETGDEVTTSGPEGGAAETVAVAPSGAAPDKGAPEGGPGKSGSPPAPPAKGDSSSEGAPSDASPPSGS